MKALYRFFTRGPVKIGNKYKIFCPISEKWYFVVVIRHLPRGRALVFTNVETEVVQKSNLQKI